VLRKEFVRDSAGAGEYRGGPAIRWDQLLRFDGQLSAAFDHMRQETMDIDGGEGGDAAYLYRIDPKQYDVESADQCYPAEGGRTPPEYREMIAGVFDPDTQEIDLEDGEFHSGKFTDRPLPAMQPFVNIVAGAGGNGDPMDRDPEAVRQDVRDDLVSVKAAEETYGVVIDESTREIDRAATAELRGD
jgi:N-methylhydantoinase B